MKQKPTLPESDAAPEVSEPEIKPAKKPVTAQSLTVVEDEPDPDEQERQEAFDAPEDQWNGHQLNPWSFARESVFYSQRAIMGAPPIDTVNNDFIAFLGDAARILWLSVASDSEISTLRSRPQTMQMVIDDWAEDNLPPGTRHEALTVALAIHNRSIVNRPTQIDDGTPAGN